MTNAIALDDLPFPAAAAIVDQAVGTEIRRVAESAKAQGAVAAARVYVETTRELDRLEPLLTEPVRRLNEAMPGVPGVSFGLYLATHSYGRTVHGMDSVRTSFRKDAWRWILDHLGVRKLMAYQQRKDLDAQIERGDLPEISEETVIGFILGMADQAKAFALTAVKEVFDWIRLRGQEYKTNSVFRLGEKAVLEYMLEDNWKWSKFWRVNYHQEGELGQLEAVFRMLDGRSTFTEGTLAPVVQAINETPIGQTTCDTEYLACKMFKNRNLHVRFKRPDLVRVINGIGGNSTDLPRGNDV